MRRRLPQALWELASRIQAWCKRRDIAITADTTAVIIGGVDSMVTDTDSRSLRSVVATIVAIADTDSVALAADIMAGITAATMAVITSSRFR